MTDPLTAVFGGICVALISGIFGKYLGGNGKVTNIHCNEKQKACQDLMAEKLDNLGNKVDNLTKAVNDKVLGIK